MADFSDRDGKIWYDGKLVEWRQATTHVLTHTLHYGLGVFEGLRAYKTPKGTAIFRLNDHTKRFFDSAKIFKMNLPYDQNEINQAHLDVIKANEIESGYLRPLAFYSSNGMGLRADKLNVHVIVACWPWGAYMGEEEIEKGARVKTSSYTRHHVNISMTKAKVTGNYANSILALQEAIDSGCDEALLLDTEGYVCEGSGENFFMIKNNTIYTPELTSALNGITRNTIMKLAKEIGLDVVEKKITRDEVYIADEAFFTGTAAEVTPIRELDFRLIGCGGRGEITHKLQSLYFSTVHGHNEDKNNWLTYIN